MISLCWLLREAAPFTHNHTDLPNSPSPTLEAAWGNPSATKAPQRLWMGPFSRLPFQGRGWMSISCRRICIYSKCLPPLAHSLTPGGTFQSKCLLTNVCNAASRPLGYSNELERRQNHSWWVMSRQAGARNSKAFWVWVSPEPLCSHILQGDGHLLLLHDRQNLSDFYLLLGKPLMMDSDNFLFCTESTGSTLLLLWWCESGRDVLLSSFLESLKDVVLGERRACSGPSVTTTSNLAATCLQPSWLPSRLRAEATR